MKIIIASIFITFSITLCQEAQITNIQAAQRTDGSQIVDIYYDLLPDQYFQVFTISLEVGLNNSFIDISSSVDGEIGQGVTPGNLKHIIWNVGSHPVFSNSFFENLTIRINGESTIIDEIPEGMVSVEQGEFDNCGESDQIDYTYLIMEDVVTNAHYAQFLIELLQNSEISFELTSYYQMAIGAYNEGDEPYYVIYGNGCKINWNGNTFTVEEGYGDSPADCVTWYGADAYANYYNYRLASPSEWIKANSLDIINNSNNSEWLINSNEINGCNYGFNSSYDNQYPAVNSFRCAANQ